MEITKLSIETPKPASEPNAPTTWPTPCASLIFLCRSNYKAISYLLPPTDIEEYYMVTVRITGHIFENNNLFSKNCFLNHLPS